MVTSSNENIQSSELGCHFGHYKAASYDRYLSVMHAAKLTLTASPGIPLARWGNGLMVLLEKVFGNIYIDKMQESVFLRPITTGSTSLYSLNWWWASPFKGASFGQNSLQKGDHRQQRGYKHQVSSVT
jgi:hypothetical protein